MKQIIINFFTSTGFKRLCWLTAEGFLSFLIVYLTDLDYKWIPFITALLANVVKYINTNYLQQNERLEKIL